MDIDRATKPIHIRCPHCKRDLEYNCASIKSQKESLLVRIERLNEKIRNSKDKQQIQALKNEREKAKFRLKLLAEDRHMLSQLSEMEVLKIFKRKARKLLGEETFTRLCQESEDEYLEENTFNYYDLAKQKFNRFNNL